MKKLTPYSELDTVLIEHSQLIQQALGDNFVGMYLQGSLATGDFDLTSDVDFIVVTTEKLTEKQANKVHHIHTQTYEKNNRWVKRMEYSFFPKRKLEKSSSPYKNNKPDASEDRQLWYFDNGSRTIKRSDHCNTLVTRWILREKGVTVIGPNPKTLIPTIDPDELRKEIKETLLGWGQELIEDPQPYRNRFYQAYLVLNFSRMLQDLHEGRVTSKLEGTKWAKNNLDPKWIHLIDFCWKERQDTEISIKQPADPEVYNQSIEFVRYAIEQGRSFQIN